MVLRLSQPLSRFAVCSQSDTVVQTTTVYHNKEESSRCAVYIGNYEKQSKARLLDIGEQFMTVDITQ